MYHISYKVTTSFERQVASLEMQEATIATQGL